MPFLNNSEDQIKKNEIKLQETLTQIEQLKAETDALFQELGLTPEQVSSYLDNPGNFSKEEWDSIQSQKKQLDEKLSLTINNLPNPAKTREAYAELNKSRHWLFVK